MNRIIIVVSIFVALLSSAVMCGPEKPDISWTGYNSVAAVSTYFNDFLDDKRIHMGDTIKVYGWLYYSGSNYFGGRQYLLGADSLQFTYNAPYYNSNVCLFFDYGDIYDSFAQSLHGNPYDSMLYVTGFLVEEDPMVGWFLEVTNVTKNINDYAN